tara:strand:- start:96 stop:458 length:363 start_codon:yes stop_codon:yes gene_type:complete
MNESRLTRLKDAGKDRWSKARGLYQCECGTQKYIDDYSVRVGKTKSCGCLNREHLNTRKLQVKRRKVGGHAIKGREPKTKGKIRIFEFYSTKSKPLGRSKWVTLDELSKIYHGILPDPFA